jgi:hypothetical protein
MPGACLGDRNGGAGKPSPEPTVFHHKILATGNSGEAISGLFLLVRAPQTGLCGCASFGEYLLRVAISSFAAGGGGTSPFTIALGSTYLP